MLFVCDFNKNDLAARIPKKKKNLKFQNNSKKIPVNKKFLTLYEPITDGQFFQWEKLQMLSFSLSSKQLIQNHSLMPGVSIASLKSAGKPA